MTGGPDTRQRCLSRCGRRAPDGLAIRLLVAAWIIGLPSGTSAQATGPAEPRALLARAIDLYMEGRYREAAERLRPLVETRVLQDRADQKEALRAYGVSLFLSGGRAGAERAFRDLLRLDPDEKLDPGFVRPEVVAFFEQVRQAYRTEVTAHVRTGAARAWANVLPPWGQFQNRHRTKGLLVLGGEIAFCGASIVTWALLDSWSGDTEEFLGHEEDYEPARIANIVAFSLCLAVVAYGVADGFYHHYYRSPPKPGPVGGSGRTWGARPGSFGFAF